MSQTRSLFNSPCRRTSSPLHTLMAIFQAWMQAQGHGQPDGRLLRPSHTPGYGRFCSSLEAQSFFWECGNNSVLQISSCLRRWANERPNSCAEMLKYAHGTSTLLALLQLPVCLICAFTGAKRTFAAELKGSRFPLQ